MTEIAYHILETFVNHQRCIGKLPTGKQCNNLSPNDPPFPEHPAWPYLCPQCANAPAVRGSRNNNGYSILNRDDGE